MLSLEMYFYIFPLEGEENINNQYYRIAIQIKYGTYRNISSLAIIAYQLFEQELISLA